MFRTMKATTPEIIEKIKDLVRGADHLLPNTGVHTQFGLHNSITLSISSCNIHIPTQRSTLGSRYATHTDVIRCCTA
jgi:hypothetical protein